MLLKTDPADVTALILVGPPAAGKSTIRNLLEDMGAATTDVSEASEPRLITRCETTIRRASNNVPVCAVEGLRNNQEVNWFASKVDEHLIVRVDTHSVDERVDRYLDRELDPNQDVVAVEDLRDVAEGVLQAEDASIPDHHVSLYNDDDVPITEIATRLRRLVHTVAPDSLDDDLLGIE